jgi:glycosyltransferase involved in cell wall biosynthesis
MKLSIVITTHNRLPLLRRAIESALLQTVPCEVVVADDCSTDGTEEYCRSLGPRIAYHRNQSHPGRSKAVNKGVKVASGDWVKLLDDDDYLTPKCIEEMTIAIEKHHQAVICSCQAINVGINEKEIGRTEKRGPGKAFYVPQEDIHYGMLMESVPFGTASQIAFHKETFLKAGGWDISLKNAVPCDEVDSCIKIAQFGDAIFINQYLVYHTLWSGSYNEKFSLGERVKISKIISNFTGH